MTDFASLIGDVARALLGEPNRKLSNARTLRFGNRGSLAVYVAGKRRGTWSDFSADTGGGMLDLIVYQRGGSKLDAFKWLQSEQLVDDDKKPVRKPMPLPLDDSQPHQTLSDWGGRLWKSSIPITADDPAGRYLRARGCALPSLDGDLRWHPALKHPCQHIGPALVGLITDTGDPGQPLNLQRTWITADGSGCKANVEPARLLLKHHRKAGGVIRLWPDDFVTCGIGLAEGIETALTLGRVFTPVWSTLDAGNLGNFPVLDGVESVTVCVDHDPAGLRAFAAFAERCTDAGREVRKVLAPTPGDDLNDWKNQHA